MGKNTMTFKDLITKDIKSVLLVEPDFPIPNKSRNHSNFLPIGLLKIASYFREKSIDVELIRFEEKDNEDFYQTSLDVKNDNSNKKGPDLIFVTSIFTYWSKYVKKAVLHYKNKYPNARRAWIKPTFQAGKLDKYYELCESTAHHFC